MPGRTTPLLNGELYHVFNVGSDKRDIFLESRNYIRFIQTFCYYSFMGPKPRFSNLPKKLLKPLDLKPENKLVSLICYCLMPNHFHFLLKQLKDNGISIFLSQLSNSYTKYFNTKNKRLGPLLQGKFKSVRTETDEQLVHVSRYIHLNPVVSGLVKNLNNYPWSSYLEYIEGAEKICSQKEVMSHFRSKEEYKKFVEEQIKYGIALESIKHGMDEDF